MAEYNIGFSKKLIEAACAVAAEDLSDLDAVRTVLYLSSLASEITLKALLEKVGIPVKDIKSRGHSLSKLLTDIGKVRSRPKSLLVLALGFKWGRATIMV